MLNLQPMEALFVLVERRIEGAGAEGGACESQIDWMAEARAVAALAESRALLTVQRPGESKSV